MLWVKKAFGPREIASAIVVLGILAVAGTYAFQYLGGLRPCTLCVYQRWAWVIAILLCSLTLYSRDRVLLQEIKVVFACLSILTGAGIAAFHVGIENVWWHGFEFCNNAHDLPKTIEPLKIRILNSVIDSCDKIPWSLFGISIAGYNLFISFIIGISGLAMLLRGKGRKLNDR